MLGTDNADHRLLAEAAQHPGHIVGVPHGMKQIDQGNQRVTLVVVGRERHKQFPAPSGPIKFPVLTLGASASTTASSAASIGQVTERHSA